MRPTPTSIVLTKAEAALRHIEAAIAAFDRGLFDVAITLAGAAEGMAPDPPTATLFEAFRDHPQLATEGIERKKWITFLNAERNWLKHTGAGPEHPPTMVFDQSSAAIMLVRAISRAQPAFGFQSEAIEAFRVWVIDDLRIDEPI
jgi:hypothetical protein